MKGDLSSDYLKQMGGLPLIAVGKNKAPLGGKNWQKNPQTAEQVAAMNGQCEMAGLLLDEHFVAVDFDGPAVPDYLLEHYDFHTDALPQTWTVTSGRPGRYALIYRQPDGQQLARLRAGGVQKLKNIAISTGFDIPDPENTVGGKEDKQQQLEIRVRGQQVVVGIHPSPQNLEYQWLGTATPQTPQGIAPLPDSVVDLILQYSCTKPATGSKRVKPLVQGLPEVNEPRWWEMDHNQRLFQLAEKWLPKEEGTGYDSWMHICSLMKATIEQNDVDSKDAVEAFLAFSQRCPGFVDENDVLDKFKSMDEGDFEDPLGMLVCKGKDGGLVLPPKPAKDAESSSSGGSGGNPKWDMEDVEEHLRKAVDEGADPADMAVLTAELAKDSPYSQAAIEKISKRMQEVDDAEQDRVARKAALANTAEIEAEFKALKLEEFLPERIATALRQAGEGMPYSDFTMLFSYLLAASSSVKLGTKVCANRVTDFVVPMNLYLAEAGGKRLQENTEDDSVSQTTDSCCAGACAGTESGNGDRF